MPCAATLPGVLRTAASAIKTAVLMPIFVAVTAVAALYIIVVSLVFKDAAHIERVIRMWSRLFLMLGPVTLETSGTEHLDSTRPYMFVSNHDSNFDIPVAFLSTYRPIRYLAKKELFGIPIFATAMRRVGMIETDRAVGVKAIGKVNTGVRDAVARGHTLMIYPEGTRTAGVELRPFKKGAFRIAIDNQLDIIPMAVTGTGEAWAPGSKVIYPGHAKVRILEPVPTEGMTPADVDALRDKIEALIHATLDEMGD